MPIMRPAPIHLSPIIRAFTMRISLSHSSAALLWQPVTDFVLPS
jgi:hypothetical protein